MQAEQATTGHDRRRFARLPLELPLQCHLVRNGRVSDTLESRSVDVGSGGVALSSGQAVENGAEMVVTFSLPVRYSAAVKNSTSYVFNHKPVPVAIRSRVVWCAPSADQRYKLGLEFMELNERYHQPFIVYLREHRKAFPGAPADA